MNNCIQNVYIIHLLLFIISIYNLLQFQAIVVIWKPKGFFFFFLVCFVLFCFCFCFIFFFFFFVFFVFFFFFFYFLFFFLFKLFLYVGHPSELVWMMLLRFYFDTIYPVTLFCFSSLTPFGRIMEGTYSRIQVKFNLHTLRIAVLFNLRVHGVSSV